MKIRHPLAIKSVSTAGTFVIKRLMRTIEYHVRYYDPIVHPDVARRTGQRYIYAFFHEMMLWPTALWPFPEMQILISTHRDGELIAQVAQRLGVSVVRGSRTRGGMQALWEMVDRVEWGHFCITPDGPRGPRRKVLPGIIYLASRTGLPIVPTGSAYDDPWRARSWDRFALPRPYTAATGVGGRPLVVPPDLDREGLETYRLELERRMHACTDEAERWIEQFRDEPGRRRSKAPMGLGRLFPSRGLTRGAGEIGRR